MKKDGLMKRKKPTKKQIAGIDLFLQRWYQIGWGTSPKTLTVRDAVNTILALACTAHVTWLHCMNVGRAPGEDISPAEGILPIAYLLEHCASAAKVRGVKCSLLQKEFAKKSRKTTDRVLDRIANKIHEIVPGYLWYSGERETDDVGA